jgi:hypothetical protein
MRAMSTPEAPPMTSRPMSRAPTPMHSARGTLRRDEEPAFETAQLVHYGSEPHFVPEIQDYTGNKSPRGESKKRSGKSKSRSSSRRPMTHRRNSHDDRQPSMDASQRSREDVAGEAW